MKQLLLPATLLLLCSMVTPPECSRFKNGKFRTMIDGKTNYIERKGDFQKEYIVGDTAILTFHIKWLSECAYTITPTPQTLTHYPTLPSTAMLTCEIIATTDTSYTTRTTANFAALVDTGTFVKVR